MATEQEYAQLSLYVYNVTGTLDNRPELPSPDWERLEYHPDGSDGFSYGVFRNNATGEVVVAYAGTNSGIDWLANIQSGAGLSATQTTAAALAYLQAKQLYGSNINFTGHSLGGGLASIMAVWFDRPAVVFDEAPFELTARNPLVIGATYLTLRALGYDVGAFAGYTGILDFYAREPQVTNYYTSEEALQLLRMLVPTVLGSDNRVEFGVDNMLNRRIDLHSMALLSAGLMSDSFRAATIAVQRSIPLIMDSSFYAYAAASSENKNFLVDLIRSEQGAGDKLTHFAADLNKLGVHVPDLSNEAQDAIIAQGIEWYYWQGTNYVGKEFFTQATGEDAIPGLLQYTTALGDGLAGAQDKAASYVGKWLTTVAAENGGDSTFGNGSGYDQWNVATSGSNITVSARDANKSQLFVGGIGNETFIGGDKSDLMFAGAGDDTLTGGAGNDILLGGAGADSYQFSGKFGLDTVLDKDGQGSLNIGTGTSPLNGGKNIADSVWESDDKKYRYTKVDGQLIVSLNAPAADGLSGTILVKDWTDGNLGLTLAGTAAAPAPTNILTGDFIKAKNEAGTELLLGTGGVNYVNGGNQAGAADLITGSDGADFILGLGGDDALLGLAGDDRIDGGDGNDVLQGGLGRDTINGGSGNDLIYGSSNGLLTYPVFLDYPPLPSPNPIVLGQGYNWVWSSPGVDADGFQKGTLTTTVGRDQQAGDQGNLIDGGAGNDWILAGTGSDVVHGGDDTDDIYGMAGNDVLFGDGGNDRIYGDGPNDTSLVSYTPPEQQGNDVLVGGAGNDLLLGQGGDDVLFGGANDDVLYGDDRDLANTPVEFQGNDYLDGGSGNDELHGNGGGDILIGGTGDDTLYGDAGQDTYIYNVGDGVDTIIDTKADKNILRFGAGVNKDNIKLHLGSLMLDLGNGDAVHIANFDQNDVFNSSTVSGFEFADGSTLSTAELLVRGFDLDGTAGDDLIIGTNTTDRINGLAGDDHLQGGLGNDVLDGGAGNDALLGEEGNDQLLGGAGVDELQGGDGDDVLDGGADNDVLFGQAGNDVLSGGDGDDQLAGGSENDTLQGGAGNDVAWGEAGDDVLAGGAGNDTLQGGLGNDAYQFGRGDGQDRVYDSDATVGNIDRVEFAAGISSDEVSASQVLYTYDLKLEIDGTNDALTIANYFYSDADKVEEIRFADGTVWTPATMPTLVQGTWDSDWLTGTAGADIFKSGAGNDVMQGGAGNDSYRYFRGDGADFISDYDTTAGNMDKIVFGADIAPSQVRVTRSGSNLLLSVNAMDSVLVSNYFVNDGASPSSVEQIKFLNDGTVWDVETVKQMALAGTSGNDMLIGYATDDNLVGLSGDDTLQGGAGNDTLDGGAGNDNLQGGSGNDMLIGGGGNDSLQGGAGDDVYVFTRGGGQDAVTDGDTTAGNMDTIQFAADIAPTDVKLRRTSFNNLEISVVGDTTVINVPFQFDANGSSAGGIERIQFLADGSLWDAAMIDAKVSAVTEGDDILFGSDLQNDTINGLGGNDALYGGAGNDTLAGGVGNDSLYGGAGNDTYVVGLNSGTDVVSETPGGLSSDVDRLVFVDAINYADAVFTRVGNDLLISNAAKGSNVSLVNQFGTDTNANGVEQVVFADGTTLDRVALGLEVGVGTAGNDVLDGNESNESMDGLGGDDQIYGRGGDDTLTGGAGNDSLYGGAGSDTYLVGMNSGYDVVNENPGGLSTDVDRLVFADGINYADVVFNRYGSDLSIYSDTKGFNLTVVNEFGAEADANGVEQVVFADGTTLDRTALMAVFTTPTAGNNVLYGGASNDFIDGLGGDDQIYGGDGDDTLRGGTGYDSLYGGNGNDTYVIQYGDGAASIMEGGSSDTLVGGVDTVSFGAGFFPYAMAIINDGANLTLVDIYGGGSASLLGYFQNGDIENIEFADGTVWTQEAIANQFPINGTSSVDVLYGTNAADLIRGQEGNDFISGNGGNDTIWGGTGKDTMYGGAGDDSLIGGDWLYADVGGDYMVGGTGNDVYRVDDAADLVMEYSSEGVDTVQSSITYTLGANVENLTLTGTIVIDGTGNELGNVLVGNSAKNTLIGNGGNDILDGGLGVDTMQGGVGDDTYVVEDSRDSVVENLNEGMDSVQSSVSHTLAANVENLTLTGTTAINGTDNGLNNLLIGNNAVNTLSGGVGNDILQGGAGNDVVKDSAGNNLLDGGAGSDVLTGAGGKELFIGGAGNDTITTGAGADIIAFNRGDGQDIVVASTGTDNTVSLGGGINYANLAMRKSGSDLILDTGNSEQLTLQNWYKGTTNHSVLNLQVVLDSTSYNPASADTLVNHRVQTFNFTTLVSNFDQALAANPTLTSWSMTDALLTAHLAGSDSAALGGDLAYQYNLNNSLTGMGLASAQTVISDANFGTAAQTLRPLSELQTGAVRLA